MRQPTSILLIVTLWSLSVGVCRAQTVEQAFSAADLKSACDDKRSNVCSAYIDGYAQGFYYSSVSSQAGFAPCVTQGLTEPRAKSIATKFMADHPEVMEQGAASVVAEALVSAFPCAKAK